MGESYIVRKGGTGGTVESNLYVFSSHTFTNAGVTGRIGPTLTQCRTAYNSVSWTQNNSFFNMSSTFSGYQLWTVPSTGNYRFIVTGATRGSASTKGASAKITATLSLTSGQKLWLICGQHGTNTEVGEGGSWVVLSNNGEISGSTPLIVAGGGGDYSFYGSESSYQTGQSFSDAQTTDNLNANVLISGIANPTTGGGGTAVVPSGSPGFGSGGGGFNGNGNLVSGGTGSNPFGRGFFNGLYGGMYETTVAFDTTTTIGAGFGGAGARNGGYGTGGGGGYTGGAFAGNNSPGLRRSTGGSSYVINTATNVTRQLASAGAPNATAQQGTIEVTKL
jgi:hypothetical protein